MVGLSCSGTYCICTCKFIFLFQSFTKLCLLYTQKAENTADIKVGTLIAIMVEEGDDWQNVEIPAQPEQSSAPAPAAPSTPPDTPKIIEQPVAAGAPIQTPPADLAQSLHASGLVFHETFLTFFTVLYWNQPVFLSVRMCICMSDEAKML